MSHAASDSQDKEMDSSRGAFSLADVAGSAPRANPLRDALELLQAERGATCFQQQVMADENMDGRVADEGARPEAD